jgi:2-dehydropantoate 2-reductase
MKIAVMGAGAVGGFLGGKLAFGGRDVVFVARGKHLEALRTQGLRVVGAEEFTVSPVTVSDQVQAFGPVDLVLFCVKLYDTESAAALLEPILADHTVVVTLQNGVESQERIGSVIGEERVLSGAAYFPASINVPGEIVFKGPIPGKPLVEVGKGQGDSSRLAEQLIEAFQKAGVTAALTKDTSLMLWEKFCWIAGVSGVTAATRQPIGTVRADHDMRALFIDCVRECATVGRVAGVPLDLALEERLIGLLETNPAEGKSSLLVDLERGRPLELDGLSGAVHRLGQKYHVPTPVTSAVYAALKPFRSGATTGLSARRP